MTNIMAYFAARSLPATPADGGRTPVLRPRLPTRFEADPAPQIALIEIERESAPADVPAPSERRASIVAALTAAPAAAPQPELAAAQDRRAAPPAKAPVQRATPPGPRGQEAAPKAGAPQPGHDAAAAFTPPIPSPAVRAVPAHPLPVPQAAMVPAAEPDQPRSRSVQAARDETASAHDQDRHDPRPTLERRVADPAAVIAPAPDRHVVRVAPRLQPAMPLATPTRRPVAATGAPSPIQVTIGRLEIRAAIAEPPPARRPALQAPALSLEDYLTHRGKP